MRRPPSYSDSFLVLNGGGSGSSLTPLMITESEAPAEPSRWPFRITLFFFKGGLHVLFISAFETAFYFLYVNRSENAGILNTLNTYYDPIVADCQGRWGNGTRWFIQQLFRWEINQTEIDAAGGAARSAREGYNQGLLVWSCMYSVICLGICMGAAGVVRWKGWEVPWRRILMEHVLFILVLGLYEVFFFRTIIYRYETLSTAELNQYLVDGLAACEA